MYIRVWHLKLKCYAKLKSCIFLRFIIHYYDRIIEASSFVNVFIVHSDICSICGSVSMSGYVTLTLTYMKYVYLVT